MKISVIKIKYLYYDNNSENISNIVAKELFLRLKRAFPGANHISEWSAKNVIWRKLNGNLNSPACIWDTKMKAIPN